MSAVYIPAAPAGSGPSPWSDAVPRAALPVANEPLLGHMLRLLARNGYRRMLVGAGPDDDLLVGLLADGSMHGVALDWARTTVDVTPVEGLLAARDELADGDEPIVVVRGTALHDTKLAPIEHLHRSSGALVTTGGARVPGVWMLAPAALDLLAREAIATLDELVARLAVAGDGSLAVHEALDGSWNDLASEAAWRAANFDAITGRVDLAVDVDDDDGGAWGAGILVHHTATIDPTASLSAPTVVGAGARVGADARLESALVLPGGIVPDGATISDATIGTPAALRAWAEALV